MSEANRDALDSMLIVILFIVLFCFIALLCMVIYKEMFTSNPVECREGKLFEVTHEGNITVYDPTFKDCEEK